MSHDMTKEDSEKTKALVEEEKQKTKELEENKDNDFKKCVFRVRGPPFRPLNKCRHNLFFFTM